ncbi:FecR family protein [Rhodoplanes sp. TEM]|uniref:FecR family protein n=1 Tax=Rhodoplanes tepidamans TaxID=200616 RepID=A0ABT5JIA6_RHOTP|nr:MULTISPECIES: FecR family protein [Rhodoplanes]MDC7789429.1 FecR family protein [Rhodoplanes tepidamans]MDC7987059.1 FecR family protein [Rhodoplanes sp. TEM]MDQ0353602.1 transmembrane sensor [Rhodoplanes tepidamans]
MTAKQSARARRRRHDEAAGWVLKNRDEAQTAEDRRRFETWLARDPQNRVAYETAERLMGEARQAILGDSTLRDFSVAPRRPVGRTVSALLLAAAVGGGAFVLLDGPMRLRADVLSGSGEMPETTLADGSTVQLNASSAVAFRFTGDTRTVVLLRGQAFFRVVADPARPFVVEAQGGRTTALGTAFDVRLGEETTDVTVVEHAVSITPGEGAPAGTAPAGAAAVRLGEGQQAVYGPDGAVRDVRAADPEAVLAWRRGQLVVDNAVLSEVVAEIGRHFPGRIVIAGAGLASRRVSGTFTVTDTDAALALLRDSLGLIVTRIGLLVVLRG